MANNVDIAVRAKNQASGPLRQVTADLQGLDKQAGSITQSFSNLATGGVGAFLGGLGIGATVAAVQQLGGAVMDLGRQAASVHAVRDSFRDLTSNVGQDADAMLGALRNASYGMISDADLMLSANKAMMLGVADNTEEMIALLDVARVRGKAMGLSVTDAFSDIVTGLGRESALILDNLGITLDLDQTYQDYAAGLGKTVAALTAVERKQALVNKVMEDSKNLNLAAPDQAAQSFAQLDAQISNLKTQLGTLALPLASDITRALSGALGDVKGFLDEVFTEPDMSAAERTGKAIGVAMKDAIIRGLTPGEPIQLDFMFGPIPGAAGAAGAATRKELEASADEIFNALGDRLGSSDTMNTELEKMKRLQVLESEIIVQFNEIMADSRRASALLEAGNGDIAGPTIEDMRSRVVVIKQLRGEYAGIMETMRNVPGPVMSVSDSLWDGITGWRDLTRASKDAVSTSNRAAQELTATAAAEQEAARASFDFATSLQYINDTATSIPEAINAAGSAINTIQSLMIQAAQAGADPNQAMARFIDADKMQQDAENLARTLSSLGIDDKTIAWTIEMNTADAIANARNFASEAEKAAAAEGKVTTEADRAKAALILAGYATASFASGLSQVQAQASATAGIIYNLTGAIQQLNAATGVMRSNSDLLGGVTSQINNVTSGLIDNMGVDAALAKGQELKVQARDQIESLRAQGYTTAEIGIIMQANVQKTQEWATGLDKVASATGGVGAATQQVNQQYEDLKSKVAGVLSGALSPDIGFDPASILPRADDINENARRLAAIANEGIIGQPWLEEFKAEAPQAWTDIMNQVAAGVDAKTAAAKIYQDFQQGLRPDLIDRGLVKERVKAMIIGEQNMAALAEEIAQDLATEMNIPLQQALAAAGGAMGVTTGAAGDAAAASGAGATDMTGGGVSAGQTWIAGFLAQADGTAIVAGIVTKLTAEMPKFLEAGKGAGTQWGTGFMSTVESGIANPLITLLVTLVTPGVMAQMAAGQSQTTPPQ